MLTPAPTQDTRRDQGRWTSVPGYLDECETVADRRAHRANKRGQGLGMERLARAQPSPHQLASLVAHAVAVALVAEPHGAVARTLARALRTAAEGEGWLMDDDLRARVETRLRLDEDELAYVRAEVAGEVTHAEHRARVTELRRRRIERCRYDLARRRGQDLAMAFQDVLDEEEA